ncbi:MBL fold metallo-hydrolase [Planctomycetota bacterium]
MGEADRIRMLWRGAANYQLLYRDHTILLDPLFTRLPGDKPHLAESRDSVERIDYLLLTHGHIDHSWDVPYLATKHNPVIYGPRTCLADVRREKQRGFEAARWNVLETCKGRPFSIADIEITPYQIKAEEIDWWFVRDMAIRPLRHRRLSALRYGIKWLTHHVFGNCFAFHFRFAGLQKSMLFFGNLTGDVSELHEIERVDLLALPYCPANQKWVEQTEYLIKRFSAPVVLVHHFDNFMNPFTRSEYIDVGEYRQAIRACCPGTSLNLSKFGREVDLADIVEAHAVR